MINLAVTLHNGYFVGEFMFKKEKEKVQIHCGTSYSIIIKGSEIYLFGNLHSPSYMSNIVIESHAIASAFHNSKYPSSYCSVNKRYNLLKERFKDKLFLNEPTMITNLKEKITAIFCANHFVAIRTKGKNNIKKYWIMFDNIYCFGESKLTYVFGNHYTRTLLSNNKKKLTANIKVFAHPCLKTNFHRLGIVALKKDEKDWMFLLEYPSSERKFSLTKDGNVYFVGNDSCIHILQNVIQMSGGWQHALFLLSTGDVYVLGVNSYGQLGFRFTSYVKIRQPAKLKFPNKIKIQEVFAHENTSFFLTKCGKIYISGLLNKKKIYPPHQYLDLPKLGFPIKCIKTVKYSRTHITILTQNNNVFILPLYLKNYKRKQPVLLKFPNLKKHLLFANNHKFFNDITILLTNRTKKYSKIQVKDIIKNLSKINKSDFSSDLLKAINSNDIRTASICIKKDKSRVLINKKEKGTTPAILLVFKILAAAHKSKNITTFLIENNKLNIKIPKTSYIDFLMTLLKRIIKHPKFNAHIEDDAKLTVLDYMNSAAKLFRECIALCKENEDIQKFSLRS